MTALGTRPAWVPRRTYFADCQRLVATAHNAARCHKLLAQGTGSQYSAQSCVRIQPQNECPSGSTECPAGSTSHSSGLEVAKGSARTSAFAVSFAAQASLFTLQWCVCVCYDARAFLQGGMGRVAGAGRRTHPILPIGPRGPLHFSRFMDLMEGFLDGRTMIGLARDSACKHLSDGFDRNQEADWASKVSLT